MILPLFGLGETSLLVAGIPPAKTRNSVAIIPARWGACILSILLSQVSQQDWIKTSCPAMPLSHTCKQAHTICKGGLE